jgi:hypothetical protein
MKTLAIALIAIGAAMMVFTGFNFVTREKVVDVGPVHVSKNKDNPVEWSPIAGVVILAAGIVVLVAARKK